MTEKHLKQQIELLGLRQRAAKIAVKLYEVAATQQEIDMVNTWFDICNYSESRQEILDATQALFTLATSKQLSIDF